MNERIKQLAEQFNMEIDPAHPDHNQIVLEKFAELIVRECADFLCKNSGYDDCDNAWFPEPEDLLAHFGVE